MQVSVKFVVTSSNEVYLYKCDVLVLLQEVEEETKPDSSTENKEDNSVSSYNFK
jgi:hypothetical protein